MNAKILQLSLVLASLIVASTPVSAGDDEDGGFVGALPAVIIPESECEIGQTFVNLRAVDVCTNLEETYILGKICDSGGCWIATEEADSDPCPTNGQNDYIAEFTEEMRLTATTMHASASCWNHLYDGLLNKLDTCKETSGCAISSSDRANALVWAFS